VIEEVASSSEIKRIGLTIGDVELTLEREVGFCFMFVKGGVR